MELSFKVNPKGSDNLIEKSFNPYFNGTFF